MCLLGAALAFASRKCSANGSDLNYASIVLISEMVKFTVAFSLCAINSGSCFRDLVASLLRRPFLPSALPSLFFAFQNNAAHLAHQSTNPITFQLLMNARSFAVALLQVTLLPHPSFSLSHFCCSVATVPAAHVHGAAVTAHHNYFLHIPLHRSKPQHIFVGHFNQQHSLWTSHVSGGCSYKRSLNPCQRDAVLGRITPFKHELWCI